MKKRTIALLVACILVIGIAVGGTVAYLLAQTGEVKNTFSVGDVNIALDESKYENGVLTEETRVQENTYNYVPGDTLPKDPVVYVWDSVESVVILEVKVENNSVVDEDVAEGATADSASPVLDWAIADGWTYFDPTGSTTSYAKIDGTYYFYKILGAMTDATQATTTTKLYVLADNQVTVSSDITKALVNELETAVPTLTFQAAIVQKDNIVTDAEGTPADTEIVKAAYDLTFGKTTTN